MPFSVSNNSIIYFHRNGFKIADFNADILTYTVFTINVIPNYDDINLATHYHPANHVASLVEYTKKQHDPNWTMLFLFPYKKGLHSENLIVFFKYTNCSS